jgi:hypothetical protein
LRGNEVAVLDRGARWIAIIPSAIYGAASAAIFLISDKIRARSRGEMETAGGARKGERASGSSADRNIEKGELIPRDRLETVSRVILFPLPLPLPLPLPSFSHSLPTLGRAKPRECSAGPREKETIGAEARTRGKPVMLIVYRFSPFAPPSSASASVSAPSFRPATT